MVLARPAGLRDPLAKPPARCVRRQPFCRGYEKPTNRMSVPWLGRLERAGVPAASQFRCRGTRPTFARGGRLPCEAPGAARRTDAGRPRTLPERAPGRRRSGVRAPTARLTSLAANADTHGHQTGGRSRRSRHRAHSVGWLPSRRAGSSRAHARRGRRRRRRACGRAPRSRRRPSARRCASRSARRPPSRPGSGARRARRSAGGA
jgi:hypothetical protein